MADISKCSGVSDQGTVCGKRERCWRYNAPAHKSHQSYILIPESEIKDCSYLIERNENKATYIK